MRVRMLAEAEAEALEAAQWYEDQQSGLGIDFLDSLTHGLEAIERNPQAFSRIPKVGKTREVRRFVLTRFPFRIVYEV